MNLTITVRLEDKKTNKFKVEELSVSARNEQSLRSMATRTLLIEAPGVITDILDEDTPWEEEPKQLPAAKKPAAKKPAAKK